MHEVDWSKLPSCKADVKFSKSRLTRQEYNSFRTVLSVSLPVYVIGATPPRPDPSHPPSLVGGVVKRFGYQPPIPNRSLLRKFGRFVELWMRRNLRPLAPDELPTIDEWLSSTDYTEARRCELSALWEDRDSWEANQKIFHKLKSFIKDETYPEFKYPRLINSRIDLAKCFIGPTVDAISHQVFNLPWFIKKIPVRDRPMVISDRLFRPDGNYIFTDYTAFEAHFTPELMRECQFRLYRYMTKNLSDHELFMKFCFGTLAGRNICQFKHVTVTLDGVRMSGEMDTSLANGFHNLMAFLFLVYQNDPSAILDGFVEGDDGIFVVSPDSAKPTTGQFAELGLTIKIGETPNLSEASFCGQVYDVDEGIVVTDVNEVLCRFGWTSKRYVLSNERTRLMLLRAKGFSLSYQYNGCPVLSALGRKIIELTEGIDIEPRILNAMDQWERQKLREAMTKDITYKTPGLSTRALVEKLYGLTVHEQLLMEDEINSMTELRPLKFSLNVSKDWQNYYEHYSHPVYDTDPCWLIQDESDYLVDLLNAAPQAEKFIDSL